MTLSIVRNAIYNRDKCHNMDIANVNKGTNKLNKSVKDVINYALTIVINAKFVLKICL